MEVDTHIQSWNTPSLTCIGCGRGHLRRSARPKSIGGCHGDGIGGVAFQARHRVAEGGTGQSDGEGGDIE